MYATILYYKNPLSKLSRKVNVALFLLRFTAVSLLAFLLLSPYLNRKTKILEKPIVVVGLDNSKSMILTADSSYFKTNFKNDLKNLLAELKTDYQTDLYLFGDNIKTNKDFDFKDNYSDYSRFLRFVKNDYRGLNVGAVVMLGDGIYNRGISPEYIAESFTWPVYSVAYGDTNTYSDLKVNNVRFNDIVYLNANFPVEVNITAKKLKGKNAVIKIEAFGKKIFEKRFLINNTRFEKTFSTLIKAEKKGKHRVKITLTTFDNEFSKQNNKKNIYVEVLDSEKKVLIVAAAPHPDISAIRSSLENYKNYKVDIVYENNIDKSPDNYNLVILNQSPSKKYHNSSFWKQLQKSNVPVLFILGRNSSINDFNKLSNGLEIKSQHGFENAQPVVNPLFSLFTFNPDDIVVMEKFPPLTVPFGNYILPSFSNIFAYQKINNITTDIPLILFYNHEKTKYGVITGEGIWLWRMHNFLLTGNFNVIESLIGKSVQYLLAREDKRHFKVTGNETFYPGEKIQLNARLYNQTWELINKPEVNLVLTDEKGKQFRYVFSRYENIYSLSINNLHPGIYKYSASVMLGKKHYEDYGEFIIYSVSLENSNLKANHQVLFSISDKTGGKMVYPDKLNSLTELFQQQKAFSSKIVYENRIVGFNNLLWFMLSILALLSTEWFLRKFFGSY